MEEKKQTNILITPETHLRLKMAAVSQGWTMGTVIEKMLDACYTFDVTEKLKFLTKEADKDIAEYKEAQK